MQKFQTGKHRTECPNKIVASGHHVRVCAGVHSATVPSWPLRLLQVWTHLRLQKVSNGQEPQTLHFQVHAPLCGSAFQLSTTVPSGHYKRSYCQYGRSYKMKLRLRLNSLRIAHIARVVIQVDHTLLFFGQALTSRRVFPGHSTRSQCRHSYQNEKSRIIGKNFEHIAQAVPVASGVRMTTFGQAYVCSTAVPSWPLHLPQYAVQNQVLKS